MSTTFDFERLCQSYMDTFYRNRGWTPERTSACREYDLILGKDNVSHKVEEKFRSEIWPDILIEILQDIPSANMGWYYDTHADYIHYAMCKSEEDPPSILYRLNWDQFRKWFDDEYLPKHRPIKFVKSNKGYGITLNIAVRVEDMPSGLYLMVDGLEDQCEQPAIVTPQVEQLPLEISTNNGTSPFAHLRGKIKRHDEN